MPLYFIIGTAGSGKSTVLRSLRDRGYEAYDVDEAGPVTAMWHNASTDTVHPKSSINMADRTPAFLATHTWDVPRQEVVCRSQQAGRETVFLGGSIGNDQALQDLFQNVFALTVDNDCLRGRLMSRTDNDWRMQKHEYALTLAVNHSALDRYQQLGYIIIDANQAVDATISQILSHIDDSR